MHGRGQHAGMLARAVVVQLSRLAPAGDQGIGRADQVLRNGNDRIRGSYYANRIETQTLYVRPVLLDGAVGVNVCATDVPHTVLPVNVQAVLGVVLGGW